jgi:hypothetical protein
MNLSWSRHDQKASEEGTMPAETRISVATLAARIKRVERLNRALFLVVAIALVIGGAALTIRYFSQPNSAAAERFAALEANGGWGATRSASPLWLLTMTTNASWPGSSRPSTSFDLFNVRRGCPAQGRA